MTAVNDLEIKPGAKLYLDNKSLTINGLLSGTGQLAGTATSDLTVKGAGSTIYLDPASRQLQNLTINTSGTIALGDTIELVKDLSVSSGIFNASKLILKSTSIQNTARVAQVGSSASITGDVTVERFIPAKRAFRFITSSVTTSTGIRHNWMEDGDVTVVGKGTHITGLNGAANGFDVNAGNSPSLFYYDNMNLKWMAVTNANTTTLSAGFAYRLYVRGDRTIDLSSNTATANNTVLKAIGSLRTGTITYNSDLNSIAYLHPKVAGATSDVFSYIGNPYASPVSWKKVDIQNVSTTYYSWDPQGGEPGGIYKSYNRSSVANDVEVDENIQPGEAFFVLVNGPNPFITFKEQDKTDIFRRVFRPTSEFPLLNVQLYFNDTTGTRIKGDAFAVVFDSSFSSFIGDEDSRKFNNLNENMAIDHLDTILSVEGRPEIVVADSIQLKLWNYRHKNYFLKFNPSNFAPGMTAYLKDAYLATETPINMGDSSLYDFSVSTTDTLSLAGNRFKIVFKQGSVLPVTVTDLKAYSKDKGVQVEWIARTETNTVRYEVQKSVDGRDFEKAGTVEAKGNAPVITYGWFDATPVNGTTYYRLKVIDKSGAVTYTSVVKVYLEYQWYYCCLS